MTIPAYIDASTNEYGFIRKVEVCNVIAAYLVSAPSGATVHDAIVAIAIGLGVNPRYIAELVKLSQPVST